MVNGRSAVELQSSRSQIIDVTTGLVVGLQAGNYGEKVDVRPKLACRLLFFHKVLQLFSIFFSHFSSSVEMEDQLPPGFRSCAYVCTPLIISTRYLLRRS